MIVLHLRSGSKQNSNKNISHETSTVILIFIHNVNIKKNIVKIIPTKLLRLICNLLITRRVLNVHSCFINVYACPIYYHQTENFKPGY